MDDKKSKLDKSASQNSDTNNKALQSMRKKPAPKPSAKPGGMKKMFMKLKQKCNLTKKTEIRKDLMDQFNVTKQYRNTLYEVAVRIRDVSQPNAEFTRKPDQLVFEAPEGMDEYEQIYSSLEKNRVKGKPFESYENVEFYAYTTYQLTLAHREFHRSATELMKPIAVFLFEEFPEIENKLEDINHLRDEKDVKEHDFQTSGVGAQAAQETRELFEKACDELIETMKTAISAENVMKHVTAMESWQGLMRQHHAKMSEELQKAILNCDEAAKKAAK